MAVSASDFNQRVAGSTPARSTRDRKISYTKKVSIRAIKYIKINKKVKTLSLNKAVAQRKRVAHNYKVTGSKLHRKRLIVKQSL